MQDINRIFDEGFISMVSNKVIIEETEQDGECLIDVIYGKRFYYIKKVLIKDFFSESILRSSCDGICLVKREDDDRYVLFLFEMKKNIRPRAFQKALKQLEASYLKVIMLLGLILDINKIEARLFIIGAFVEKDKAKLDSKTRTLGSKYTINERRSILFQRFIKNGFLNIDTLPKYLNETINPLYIKKDIGLYHKNCGESISIKEYI